MQVMFISKNLKNYIHDISWVFIQEAVFPVILATNY
jgi:hypothetical protein